MRYCGIDFGTSNSSAALVENDSARVLDLDPRNDAPTSLPSLLYITKERKYIVGRAAANAFIERNVDREVLLKRIDLETAIEAYVASEPDKSDAYRPREDMGEVRDAVRASAVVEVNSPGRLFQSLKSSLRFANFRGTEVFGRRYQITELISLVLRRIKRSVDEAAGESVEGAVMGRPVRFSASDEENALAEKRLRAAAEMAGFKDVAFFYEPVAACIEYAAGTVRRQRLMVVDIGGGTCDVCVMEFGGSQGVRARLAESVILSVAGVPVAGDAIDREIIRARIFPRLGSRSRYGPSNLPMPQYVYNAIADWQNLYRMNTEEVIHWLIATEASSTDPAGIRALRTLIQRNYGYPVAREVEAAKKRLSSVETTNIEIRNAFLEIEDRLERTEFAHIIEGELAKMQESILDAEKLAGVRPDQIDCVLTTGGTSLIPAVRQMLEDRYGRDRLLQRDTFTSVATGLAIVAQYAE
ncbi:MAG TPA: Hsp70 family protein [Candidatus Hydrogenedentes bacterium]|mgnify:CR=1 FL=1|nr:Hsp70 family protein [Candidatus Hydrogenedentota bacterium]